MTDRAQTSVLVVDDEVDMVEMLAFWLSGRGYEVSTTTSGRQAVELARRRSFDLVICDLKMPEFDGIDTTTALKEVKPDLDVIIATAYITDKTTAACLECGVAGTIRKPFTLKDMESLIRRVLSKRRSRRS